MELASPGDKERALDLLRLLSDKHLKKGTLQPWWGSLDAVNELALELCPYYGMRFNGLPLSYPLNCRVLL
jgi:hypothetical protein